MCRGWKNAGCCSIHPVTPRRHQLSPVSAAAISVFCLCPLWGSCQVSSFWRAFTSLNDIWQQWKATENCLLIRAKLVDGTDEVVSQRCGHIQVMTFAPRAQEPNRIQLHYYHATCAYSPEPSSWLLCLRSDKDNLLVLVSMSYHPDLLMSTCKLPGTSVLTNIPRDTEVSISPKSNCAVLKKK